MPGAKMVWHHKPHAGHACTPCSMNCKALCPSCPRLTTATAIRLYVGMSVYIGIKTRFPTQAQAGEELQRIMGEEQLRDAVILVLANKQASLCDHFVGWFGAAAKR